MKELLQHILYEYYERISSNRDTDILGNWLIYIYSYDRPHYTPHCHVLNKQEKFEFEVSLLDWEVINIKNHGSESSWNNVPKSIKYNFFEWLKRTSVKSPNLTNKQLLYTEWDGGNPSNTLEEWKDSDNIDEDLITYIDSKGIDLVSLRKEVIGLISEFYYQDANKRQEFHDLSTQEKIKFLSLPFDLVDNLKAIETIEKAEKDVYFWSMPR